MARRTYDTPSRVSAEEGDVVVAGPDGVDVALTPDAAIETSERLLDRAAEAQGQRVWQKAEEDNLTQH